MGLSGGKDGSRSRPFLGQRVCGGQSGLQFAFAEAIAPAFNEQQIHVVGEPVDEGGDAGGMGKDGVPVFESTIGAEQNGAAFVTAIDDFEEQVGGAGVVREITNFVDAKDLGAGIEGELTAAELKPSDFYAFT